jgi:hypothetical protein
VSRDDDPPAADVAEARPAQAPTIAETNPADGVMRLAHTDWLHHRLTLCAAPDDLAAFRAAARGAGIIPWTLDLDRLEEDWFLRLVAPATPQAARLSAVGARILAAQLREAVARRHAIAVSAVGVRQACPFDLHALVPVPDDILHHGPDDPRALAWLWEHWGTTTALRHVTDVTPEKDRLGGGTMRVSFWSADWTPWRALVRLAEQWPAVRFDLRPDYDSA